MWLLSFLTGPRYEDAIVELREELTEFAYDGLVQLRTDLERGMVKRGTWDGCALSYRRGYAGSVDCDRKARRGNVFTRFWDSERFDKGELLKLLSEELATRHTGPQQPAMREPEPTPV